MMPYMEIGYLVGSVSFVVGLKMMVSQILRARVTWWRHLVWRWLLLLLCFLTGKDFMLSITCLISLQRLLQEP